jgi:hypothetical protein
MRQGGERFGDEAGFAAVVEGSGDVTTGQFLFLLLLVSTASALHLDTSLVISILPLLAQEHKIGNQAAPEPQTFFLRL